MFNLRSDSRDCESAAAACTVIRNSGIVYYIIILHKPDIPGDSFDVRHLVFQQTVNVFENITSYKVL